MFEIKLAGLNSRQRFLADIMWNLEEWDDIVRFIKSLPKRERVEAEGIIEMMKMELVEGYRKEMGITETPEADAVIAKARRG